MSEPILNSPSGHPPILDSEEGIHALKVSVIVLGATALIQAVITIYSGSAALFADTLHNMVDVFTAVPLWIAFSIQKRKPDRHFTYGYSRFEDIAGIVIVCLIFLAAYIVGRQALERLQTGHVPRHLGWVMAASVIGFIGNEWVARYRVAVGRKINSPALIADGEHARADAFTSLGVLAGAIGVALGHPLADPLVGFIITGLIIKIGWETGRDIIARLADAISPDTIQAITNEAAHVPGVLAVHDVRARNVGRQIRMDLTIEVDGTLSVFEGHEIAVHVQHTLQNRFPRLISPMIHVDPQGHPGEEHHFAEHHRAQL